MPSALRSRFALFALLGAFLIPVATSSLRGLTHVLTCSQRSETPFQLIIPDKGPPMVLSSTRISRESTGTLCGGLTLDMRARGQGPGRVAIIVVITNRTPHIWRGTVDLLLQKTSFPVAIGEIRAGATGKDTVQFKLEHGSHELNGSLLIGP